MWKPLTRESRSHILPNALIRILRSLWIMEKLYKQYIIVENRSDTGF